VVASARLPESLALAERYRAARSIPRGQVCALDLPDAETVPLSMLRARGLEVLERCLTAAGARERIEALVLMRGLPLRVDLEGPGRVSIAAALASWRSTETSTGRPLLGMNPARLLDCGGQPCAAAAWENPFRRGTFAASWSAERQGITHRPLLVTMLHGRSFADAARLIASATTAEALGSEGTFLFMDGADPARGVLDRQAPRAIAELTALGLDAQRVPFSSELGGRRLAAFITGSAALGAVIEGNRFAPGALVDNLTSLGAVPENFRDSGEEVQVSIARWVARGVAGVHGATDEPLNNCFPQRRFLVDYAEGSTLGEAYARHLPFVYWHNLVLGDVMAAPHARRPVVRLLGPRPGDTVAGSTPVTVSVEDPLGRRIRSVSLFVDGREVQRVDGAELEGCVAVPRAGAVQLLAVAQVFDDGRLGSQHEPKGWTALTVEGAEGPTDCAPLPVDAGMPDVRTEDDAPASPQDGGPEPEAGVRGPGGAQGEGCGCASTPAPAPPLALLALAVLFALRAYPRCVRRGRRPRPTPRD
jgi:uncharacterized protein (TIGR03790 family)